MDEFFSRLQLIPFLRRDPNLAQNGAQFANNFF